jgi:DNA mismatch repair protein PMS2
MKPLPLELSSSEETCVLENKELFEKNGFRFAYDATKPVRERLSLTALPHSGSGAFSKAVQFTKDDVSALCALLGADTASTGFIAGSGTGANGDGSMGNNAVRRYAAVGGEVVRLPKTVAMFASRACRSSKMIGDALTEKDMHLIVDNLKSVVDPWTCPHGRPTLRHVKELLSCILQDEYLNERRIKGPTLTAMTQMDE